MRLKTGYIEVRIMIRVMLAFAALALVVLLLAAASAAFAQETQPEAACAAGEVHLVRHVGGPENPNVGYDLVCNGTNWKHVREWDTATGRSLFQVNNDTGSCTAAKLGRIRYNGTSTWDYCNGTSWTAFNGTTTPASPDRGVQFNSGGAFTAASTFVYTSAGRVGIGTASPGQELTIASTDATDADLEVTGGGAYHAGIDVNRGTTSKYAKIDFETNGVDDWVMGTPDIDEPWTATGDQFIIGTTTAAPEFVMDRATGRLGLGSTAPDDRLHLIGQLRIDNDTNTTNKGCIRYDGTGNKLQFSHDCSAFTDMGVGTPASPDRSIQFNSGGAFTADANFYFTSAGKVGLDYTDTANASGWQEGRMRSSLTVAPTSDHPTGGSVRVVKALTGYGSIPASNTRQIGRLIGTDGSAENYGSGNIERLIGLYAWAYNNPASANSVTGIRAASLYAESDGGTVTNLSGADIWLGIYGGTVTNQYGMDINPENAGGALTNQYGAKIYMSQTSGTTTNSYGLYISGDSGATNDYGIYQANSGATNYFRSQMVVGTTSSAIFSDAVFQIVSDDGVNFDPDISIGGTVKADVTLYNGRGNFAGLLKVEPGDILGTFRWGARDTTGWLENTSIEAAIPPGVANTGANDVPSEIRFFTTPDGSASNTQRMVIAHTGNIGIGTTTPTHLLNVKSAATGTVNSAQFESNPGTGSASYNAIKLSNTNTTSFKNQITFVGNGAEKWSLGNDESGNGSQNFFLWDSVASSIRLFVTSTGAVGIGNNAPASRLVVAPPGAQTIAGGNIISHNPLLLNGIICACPD